MDLRPIGVFDSGVGGLTAVRELRKLLPGEDILYFADTANVPYGGRDVGQLRALAAAATEKLCGLAAWSYPLRALRRVRLKTGASECSQQRLRRAPALSSGP